MTEPDDEVILALLGLVKIGYEARADYLEDGPDHHWTDWERIQDSEVEEYQKLAAKTGGRYEVRPLYTTKS